MKNLYLFLLLLVTTFTFGQSSVIQQIDNPLMRNAIALQNPWDWVVSAGFDFRRQPYDPAQIFRDSTGGYLGRLTASNQFGKSARVRYALIKGLEVSVGYKHKYWRINFEDVDGDLKIAHQNRSSAMNFSGRYSYSLPESGLDFGVQLNIFSQVMERGFLLSGEGISADIFVAKKLNEKHRLTGGVGFKNVFYDDIYLSLMYNFTPNQNTGYYSVFSYNRAVSSLGHEAFRGTGFGLGGYFAPTENLRFDLAGRYTDQSNHFSPIGNPFEIIIGAALVF